MRKRFQVKSKIEEEKQNVHSFHNLKKNKKEGTNHEMERE